MSGGCHCKGLVIKRLKIAVPLKRSSLFFVDSHQPLARSPFHDVKLECRFACGEQNEHFRWVEPRNRGSLFFEVVHLDLAVVVKIKLQNYIIYLP